LNDEHYDHGEICYRVKSSREPHGRAVKEVCCVTSQVRSSRPREVRHHWEAREQRQYRHHWKAGYCRQNRFWLMLCQAQGCGHRDWYCHRWSPLFERIAMPCEIRRFNGLRQALPAVLQVGQHRNGATVRPAQEHSSMGQ
jgi:hypothetical protein